MKPLFITFEGAEASGKSTLSKAVSEALKAEGGEVVLTREPGGVFLAEQARELLLRPPEDPRGGQPTWHPTAELFLVNAARVQHTQAIRAWLALGFDVLSDRYVDSTLVYQNIFAGFYQFTLRNLHEAFIELWPDITFLVDIEPEEQQQRLKCRAAQDRFDRMTPAQHEEVIYTYRRLANKTPRIQRIPVGYSVQQSVDFCLAKLEKYYQTK